MGEERSELVEELFQRAADLPAEQRKAFLQAHCGSDLGLLGEVETLLRHEREAPPAFLRGHADETRLAAEAARTAAPLVGKRIGRYQILRVIASGGMGTVYEAEQERPRRSVALKVLKFGLAAPDALRRFAHEAEILGRLRHPGIAQVYEAGTHEDGSWSVPFFAMEYIAGAKAITDYARDLRLSRNQRLELFAKVCDAVLYGHQKGVIHRDLKPSNILVTSPLTPPTPRLRKAGMEEVGQVKIIDFGVARVTDADMTIATLQTDVGQLVGTLRYMSPEQCAGDPAEIDTRSDVYALGVALYELLTDRLPYDLTTPSPFEIPRIIREEAPRRLSAINRSLRGDVQTIVLKALEKDRERRYQSAGDLARDIRHYLAGEPIEARRDSAFYVLRKQMRRYRVPLAVATGFVLLLIASSVVAWTLYVRSQDNLWDSLLAQARAMRQTGRPGQRLDSLDALAKAAAIRPSIELRSEAIACLALTDLRIVKQIDTGFRAPHEVNFAFSRRGDRYWLFEMATATTTVRRISDNRTLLTLPPAVRPRLYPRFNRDGRLIAWMSKSGCEVWDIDRAEPVKAISVDASHLGQPYDFRPDNQEIAVGCEDGSIHIHSLTTGDARILKAVHKPVHRIRYRPAGDLLVTSSRRSYDVLVRDALNGEVLHTLEHPSRIGGIAWSPDGRQLAAGCVDGNLYVWKAETGLVQFTLREHRSAVSGVGFDAEGARLFSASWDGTTRLWDARTGTHLLAFRARGLSFSTETGRLAFGAYADGVTLEIAEIVRGDALCSLVGQSSGIARDGCQWLRVSGDGRWIASACKSGVRLWDVVRGRQVALLPTGWSYSAVFRPDGSELITAGEKGVWRWPLQFDTEAIRIGPPQVLLRRSHFSGGESCFRSDGHEIVVTSPSAGKVAVLDPDQHREPRFIGPHKGLRYLSISPDDKWLATGAWGGTDVKIWDLAGGELIQTLPIGRSAGVGFSPDGKWLVTSETEHTLWRTDTWEAAMRFPAPGAGPTPGPIAFSADGRLLAVLSGRPPSIELLDLARLEVIARLKCPGETGFESMVFTPDGTRLIFPDQAEGHIVYVWDLRAVRRGLAAMDLDWDLPPYPPAPPPVDPEPLRVELDLGDLALPPPDKPNDN